MDYAVIRYGVKDESLAENRALIARVFAELDRSAPQGLRYLALELEGGEFVHVVGTDEQGTSPLTKLASFKAFTESHAERRSTAVMRSPAGIVGNYRMLAGARAEA
jgi:hypothetical protein